MELLLVGNRISARVGDKVLEKWMVMVVAQD